MFDTTVNVGDGVEGRGEIGRLRGASGQEDAVEREGAGEAGSRGAVKGVEDMAGYWVAVCHFFYVYLFVQFKFLWKRGSFPGSPAQAVVFL